jgi:hypothetical protein
MLDTHDLRRLCVGFLCELIGMVGVLERSFGMPSPSFIVAFFIVFGGGAMSACRKFVLFGGLPVCFVHSVLPLRRDRGLWAVRASLAGRCDILRARVF